MQITAEIAQKLRALAFHESSLIFIAADPGAYANFKALQNILDCQGITSRLFSTGWASKNTSSPELKSIEQFEDERPILICIGSRTDFKETHAQIRDAKRLNLRSLFFFDAWKNYLQHFHDGDGEFFWPSVIVFPDDACRIGFLDAVRELNDTVVNIESELIVLTHFSLEEQAAAISRYEGETNSVPVFFLDPIALRDSAELGYSCCSILREARDHARQTLGVQEILVKPHPRQDLRAIHQLLDELNANSCFKFVVVEEDVTELVARHQHIWGSTTVVLILAAWANKTILSWQTGRNNRGKRMSNHYLDKFLAVAENPSDARED